MKYLQIYPCEVLGKNTGQFLFPNRSNTTATDGSTFVFRSGRSLVWRFTKYGGDLDSNRKTQSRYSSHWHRFAAFSRNRCFPLFSLGGVLFSSHPPTAYFFFFQILVASRTIPFKIRDRLYDCFCTKPANGQVLDIVLSFWIIIKGFMGNV